MESKTCSSLRFDGANRRKDGCKSWTCMNIFNNKKTLLTTATASTSVVESFCQLWSLNAPQYHHHMFGSKKLLLPLDSNNDNQEEDEQEKRQPIELQLAQNLCISKHAHVKNKNNSAAQYSWGWLVKGKSKANRKFKIHFEETFRNKEFHDHLQQVANKTDHDAVLSLTRLAAARVTAACFRPTAAASSKPLLINIEDHDMTGPAGAINHKLSGGARLRWDPESLRAGVEVFVVMPSGKPEFKWVTVYRKHKQLILSFRKKYMSGILTAMKEYKIVMIVEGNHGGTEGYSQLCLKTSDGIIKLLYRDEKQKMIWASTISNLLQVQDCCS